MKKIVSISSAILLITLIVICGVSYHAHQALLAKEKENQYSLLVGYYSETLRITDTAIAANNVLVTIQKDYDDYISTVEQQKKAEEPKQTVKKETKKEIKKESASDADNNSVLLNVANICQNPELPTGCEAVSATIVLNYYGAGMSKTELVDNYLTYSNDPYQGFCGGTPYDQPDGSPLQWVAAGPIKNAMNKAIAAHGIVGKAMDISGSSFETVLSYIKSGHPVVFWALENMQSGDHTLVLIGYDMKKNICYFADPMKSGIQSYNMDITKKAYNSRGCMAVIIQ